MKIPNNCQASFGTHGEQLSFLEPLSFSPKYPNPSTLAGEALARMLRGERITQPSFGTNHWRLAAYIKELKYGGWPIADMNVPRPAKWGAGKPIKEYWLPDWVISQLSKNEGKS